MGEIRRDQRAVLQEQERRVIAARCALTVGEASHLRLFEEADEAEFHALVEANRAGLSRWLPWAERQTLEDSREYLEQSRAQALRDEAFQLAVVCDDRIAGAIGCVSLNWNDRATNIGYWLGEEFRGGGTMTAAVRVLTGHAFQVWEMRRVEIRVASENRPSRAIPERLGFTEEGILRDAQRIGERYLDLAVYSMLARDWPNQAAHPGMPKK